MERVSAVPGTPPEQQEPASNQTHSPAFLVPDPYVRNEEQPALGLFVDIAALLAGGLPAGPEPRFCHRADGPALFYLQQVNLVFGEPESGKTWLALAALQEALSAGCRVAVIDLDHNGPESTVSRLLGLGASSIGLSDPERFLYVEPEDSPHLAAVVRALVEWRAELVVVDSIGELLPMLGLNSNSPDDFTVAHTRVLKPLATAGAAVIGIDHVAKNAESAKAGPTGTAAKRRAVGGISLRVKVTHAFTPGQGGSAALSIHKDRHGGLRRHCPVGDREPYAGQFVLTDDGQGALTWRVTSPADNPTAGMSAAVRELAQLDPPPASVRDVKDRLNWGTDKASDALREWRESASVPVPHPSVRNAEHPSCAVCNQPMVPLGDGSTSHPSCGEA